MRTFKYIIFLAVLMAAITACSDKQGGGIDSIGKTNKVTSSCSSLAAINEQEILEFYELHEDLKSDHPYTFIVNKYIDLALNYFGELDYPIEIQYSLEEGKIQDFVNVFDLYNEHYEQDELESSDLDRYFNFLYETMFDEINQMPIVVSYADMAKNFAEADGDGEIILEDEEPTITIGGAPYSKLELLYLSEYNIHLPCEEEDEHIDVEEHFEPISLDELENSETNNVAPRHALRYKLRALWPQKIRYRNYKNKCPNIARMQSCMQEWSSADNNYIYFEQIPDNGWNRFSWGIGCNYHLCLSRETDSNCAGSASVGCVPWATIKMSTSALRRSYLHELGHVLCLMHEIQRADRDVSVIVNYDNIKCGYKSNFWKKLSSTALPMGYFGFSSVMMYGPYAFAKPGCGQTIERIEGGPEYSLGSGLSEDDIRCIRIIYHP